MADIARLPLGVTSFKNFLKRNKIYVDKTDLIASFASLDAPCFLSRPRRFGKTTIVNTLHELFESDLTNFKALKIEKDKLWDEKTYKVLHLNFTDLKAVAKDIFSNNFKDYLQLKGETIDIPYVGQEFKNKDLSISLEKWFSLIKEPIVLLIDEYDAPLTASLDNKEEFNLRHNVLSSFFSKVKDGQDSDKLRFIFITGVTRYSQTSIFSAFNNLKDLTFNPKYGALVGYSQEEPEYYFKDYIENAAIVLNKEEDTTEYNYDVIVQG